MRTALMDLLQKSVLLLVLVLLPSLLSSQTTQPTSVTPLPEDSLSPAEFTTIMKEAWTYVKEEHDNYVKEVGSKTEFETSAEFDKRSIEAHRQYLTKINKYTQDKTFAQRVIGVVLPATLDRYDADTQIYSVLSPSMVEAPYNLPTISTEIPSNSYVGLADSIRKGYRTSSIYLKFDPAFRWQVARDIAQAAKKDEANVCFKVRFKIDLTQDSGKKSARFAIVPKQIVFMNQKSKTIYWEQNLR
jgi:hypothetical protein